MEIILFIVGMLGFYYFVLFIGPKIIKLTLNMVQKIKDNKLKLLIASLAVILIAVWLLGFFLPRQNCLQSIVLEGDRYKYGQYNWNTQRFKTRNDALDYCMALRWK